MYRHTNRLRFLPNMQLTHPLPDLFLLLALQYFRKHLEALFLRVALRHAFRSTLSALPSLPCPRVEGVGSAAHDLHNVLPRRFYALQGPLLDPRRFSGQLSGLRIHEPEMPPWAYPTEQHSTRMHLFR